MTSIQLSPGAPRRVYLLVLCLLFVGLSVSSAQNTPPPQTNELLDAMEIQKGHWAADVGCGDGDYTIPMAARVGPSGRVFAVDIDHRKLDELNDRLAARDIDNVTSVYSVEDNPMLPAQSLDAVLVRNAYHHFTAHESMLRHIRAALKSGGRLVIEESIDNDLVGESRERQTRAHDLGIEYVREELQAAGYTIQDEVNPLSKSSRQHHWLIVATPSGS